MLKSEIGVVVPVYKPHMSKNELISFRQTLNVLGSYPIIMVYPDNMDVSEYEYHATCDNLILLYESFNCSFFVGLEGYNRLMLSEKFYRRFQKYYYILICQLDTYIFRDELIEWADKGFDYIGAPWVDMENKKMIVGNGGLSLRRVRFYLDFFEKKQLLFPIKILANHIGLKQKPYTRWLVWLLMAFGWHNNSKYVASHYRWNEDCFWSRFIKNRNCSPKIPLPIEAARFSFERYPRELYKLIGEMLPFGCHAWEKNQYDSFWKNFIE